MKKFLSLALALVLSLICCAALAEEAAEKPVLTVALSPDFAPMEFVDTSKEGQDMYVGFDITLAKYLADELGMTLEIKPMSFDACQVAVATGAVDMSISGFSRTDERAEKYELSDPYIAGENESRQSIIVLAENAGLYPDAASFSGKTVGAQDASLQYNLCLEQLPADVDIKLYKAIDDAVLSLKTGKIDAVAVARGNGEAIMVNNPDIAFTEFEFVVSADQENNVILIQKGNTELLEKVNAALAKALENGYYGPWYTEAKELAGIETASEVSYDENGNAQ